MPEPPSPSASENWKVKCSHPGDCQLRVPVVVFVFQFVVLVFTVCLALQLFVLLLFNGKALCEIAPLVLQSWRRQLMDIESILLTSYHRYQVGYLKYSEQQQQQLLICNCPVRRYNGKCSSRNELNCNTFWPPIRSYLGIIKSDTCSEGLMSPLQLNYRAARAENQCQSVEWTK